jgi:hypothetical protein
MTADAQQLIDFLADRDEPCPLCGYNLRNLTEQRCPECKQPLRLTVGLPDVRLRWFLATIAPGMFAGLAGLLMLLPIIISPLAGGGPAPWQFIFVDAFFLASGIAALLLMQRRHRFVRLPGFAQVLIAVGTWIVHVLAICFLIASSI